MPGEPLGDVGHHALLADVAQQVVEVAVVQPERLVRRAGLVEEELAAMRLRRPVGLAVQDQNGQGDLVELLLEALVGAHHLGQRLRGAGLVNDEGVVLHRLDHLRIAREVLGPELEHVRARGDVADPLRIASAKSGAGTSCAKLSHTKPASPDWLSSAYRQPTTPPALCPRTNAGSPGSRDFASVTTLARSAT